MSDKEFKSLNKQLRILRVRGVNTGNGSMSKRLLEFENYYSVVNGYKDPFVVSSGSTGDVYRPGTTLREIAAVYEFDRELRVLLLPSLLLLEHHVKAVVAYEFSRNYTHHDYLRLQNFDVGTQDKIKNTSLLIANLHQDIVQSAKDPCISHYLTTYGSVPLWVLANAISFGRLSVFYSNMKLPDRQAVAKHFGIGQDVLGSFLRCLSLFRNRCAHDERVYNFKAKDSVQETALHSSLQLARRPGGRYVYGTDDILAVLIGVRVLCGKTLVNTLVRGLSSSLDRLSRKISTVSVTEIMDRMGLPSNWRNVARL